MISNTIEILKELIRIESSYFNEKEIIDYVYKWFKNNQIPVYKHSFSDHKVTGVQGENIISILDSGRPGPAICLNGHLDTVKLCNGWTKDPYHPSIEENRLYGLGALDMKSGCASIMSVLKAFVENKVEFKGKIITTLVSGEEGPYGLGTNALIEDNIVNDIDLFIVTEPGAGFSGVKFPNICLGARGGYGLTIEFFGTSAHAATPEKGLNAAVEASKCINELEKIELRKDPYLGKGSLCVIKVTADGGACSVPDYAKIDIFRHIVIGEDETSIEKEIKDAIERADIKAGYKITFRDAPSKGSQGFLPYIVSETNPYVVKLKEIIKDTLQEETSITYFKSIGDFNYLATRQNHAPCIIIGPSGGNFHGADEYVDIDGLEKTTKVLYKYLVDILK